MNSTTQPITNPILQDVGITISLHVPTNWNQLTPKQVLFVSRLFLLNLTLHNFRVRAFCHFAGIQPIQPSKTQSRHLNPAYPDTYFFLKGKRLFTIEAQEFLWFLKSMDFLTADSSLTVNPFPSIRLLWKKWEGPRRKCYDLTLIEFLHAEKCLFEFHTKHSEQTPSFRSGRGEVPLNRLCAVLYRHSRRKPFDEGGYAVRSRLLRFVAMPKRYAIYTFYAGCRNALFAAHPKLFGASISSSPVNPIESLKKTIYELTAGDVTKTRQIEATPVWEAFSYLQNLMEQAKPQNPKHPKL